MAFPQDPLVVTVELFLGGAWVDITADVYDRNPISIAWGRKDEASQVDTTKCPLTINNGRSNVNPSIIGRYSPRNPNSDLFGLLGRNTPVRISVTTPTGAVSRRFTGEVSSWPLRWDVSGNDVWVAVEAAGIKRRLAQGLPALRDSLRRHIELNGPLAYWPLTDGETARQGSEVVSSAQPMRAVGESGSFFQGQPDWGKGSLAQWLDPVVQLPDETTGRITAGVPPRAITEWSVDHAFAGGGAGYRNSFEVWDTGPRLDSRRLVERTIDTDAFADEVTLHITEWGETGTLNSFPATITGSGIFDDNPHHIRLTVADDGAGGTDWSIYIDGVLKASGNHASDFNPVARLTYRWGTVEGGGVPTEAMALGHITYWGETAPDAADTFLALRGHERELAGRRIERLCAETSVPFLVTGNLDDSPEMGPQKPGRFLELLQTAADVDGGVIYESREELGLAYRTNTSKYNQ